MILIPPGEFMMGSTDEQVEASLKTCVGIYATDPNLVSRIKTNERPQHRVVITKPYFMGTTEVTIGQFKKFADATKYATEAEQYGFGDSGAKVMDDKVTETHKQNKSWRAPGYAVTDDSPVAQITWNDAVAFCQWLSTQEKAIYRLPTEAEWEYACRAGTTTQYSFGDDMAELDEHGWFDKNSGGRAHPVGLKQPNAFGLHDMHGNLNELCGDYWNEKWYDVSPPEDPTGPSKADNRIFRGGGFGYGPFCRSATRNSGPLRVRARTMGFRVVRVLDAPAPAVANLKSPSQIRPPSAPPRPSQSLPSTPRRPKPIKTLGPSIWVLTW